MGRHRGGLVQWDRPSPSTIRAVRESAGLTQEQAAALCGLGSKVRWSEYERGIEVPSYQTWALFLIVTESVTPSEMRAVVLVTNAGEG